MVTFPNSRLNQSTKYKRMKLKQYKENSKAKKAKDDLFWSQTEDAREERMELAGTTWDKGIWN